MDAVMPHLVPAEEAAPRLHRHPITLRRDLREGRVPGVKIGGRWFLSSAALDRLTGGVESEVCPTCTVLAAELRDAQTERDVAQQEAAGMFAAPSMVDEWSELVGL